MHRSGRRLVLAVAVAGALGLAACGDTGSDADADGPSASGDCGSGSGATVTVEIGDFVFDPTPVEVDRCDEVVWRNVHDQGHTATGTDDEEWDTGNLAPGEASDPIRFEDPGDLAYVCTLHPFMKGTVRVT